MTLVKKENSANNKMMELKDIVLKFGGVTAIKDVSFDT